MVLLDLNITETIPPGQIRSSQCDVDTLRNCGMGNVEPGAPGRIPGVSPTGWKRNTSSVHQQAVGDSIFLAYCCLRRVQSVVRLQSRMCYGKTTANRVMY
jgi:hypothetical protein